MKKTHTITVHAFRCGTEKEAALKPLEEAAEVYGAWQRWQQSASPYPDIREYAELSEEIADCIQACVNLADRAGIKLDHALAAVEEKNRRRGRYQNGQR